MLDELDISKSQNLGSMLRHYRLDVHNRDKLGSSKILKNTSACTCMYSMCLHTLGRSTINFQFFVLPFPANPTAFHEEEGAANPKMQCRRAVFSQTYTIPFSLFQISDFRFQNTPTNTQLIYIAKKLAFCAAYSLARGVGYVGDTWGVGSF